MIPILPPLIRPTLHLLLKLLAALKRIMMQADALPRNRLPDPIPILNRVAVLPHRARPVRRQEHVRAQRPDVGRRLDYRLDEPVVLVLRQVLDGQDLRRVRNAGREALAHGVRSLGEVRGGVQTPVHAYGADVRAVEVVQEGSEGLPGRGLEELVGIDECYPGMLGAVQAHALAVDVGLHLWVLCFLVVVLEREGGARDTEVLKAGEGRIGAVVHDVEAADAMVVIVVVEEFGEVADLIPVRYAEGDVFAVPVTVGQRSGFGCAVMVEGIGQLQRRGQEEPIVGGGGSIPSIRDKIYEIEEGQRGQEKEYVKPLERCRGG